MNNPTQANSDSTSGNASDALLRTDDLSREYGTTPQFWEQLRTRGDGPEFIKVGRLVRYRRSAVESWLDGRTVRSTTEARNISSSRPEE